MVEKEELERLYWDEGKSLSELGVIYGCDKKTVQRWMKKYDIPRRGEGLYVSAEAKALTKEDFLSLYPRLSKREIAGRYGVSEGWVKWRFRQLGITGHRKPGPRFRLDSLRLFQP